MVHALTESCPTRIRAQRLSCGSVATVSRYPTDLAADWSLAATDVAEGGRGSSSVALPGPDLSHCSRLVHELGMKIPVFSPQGGIPLLMPLSQLCVDRWSTQRSSYIPNGWYTPETGQENPLKSRGKRGCPRAQTKEQSKLGQTTGDRPLAKFTASLGSRLGQGLTQGWGLFARVCGF